MPGETVVETLIVRQRVEGAEQVVVDLDRVTAAENRSVAASERATAATEKAGRYQLSAAAALEKLARQMDAEYRAIQQVERAQALLDRARSQGLAGTDAYARASAALVARQERLAEVNDRAAASTRRLAEAQAAQVRTRIEGVTGVRIDFGTDARAADVAAYGAELDRTRVKFDPLFRAQAAYRSGLQELREALAVGAISEAAYTSELERRKAAFTEQANGLGLYSRAQREAAAAAEAAARTEQEAATKARAQGMVSGQTVSVDRGADIAAYGQQLDALRTKYSPLFAAQTQYRTALTEIAQAARVGAITEGERTFAIARTKEAFAAQVVAIRQANRAGEDGARSTALHAGAWQNLGYQVNDVVTSLASGISPFQTLAQQGGQIFQILQGPQGVGPALREIGTTVARYLTPVTVGIAAIGAAAIAAAAATYRFLAGYRDVELSLLGAGRAAGLTADDVQALAERAAKASDISVVSARNIAREFLQTGKILAGAFEPGISAAEKFAKARGVTEAEAGKSIAGSLARLGSGGYEELARQAGNFDAKLEDQVRALLNSGQTMEAQILVARRFGEAFTEAGDKLTGLQRKLSDLDQGFKNAADAFGKAVAQRIGAAPVSLQEQLDLALKGRETLKVVAPEVDTSAADAKIEKLRAALKQAGDEAQREAVRVRQNADAANKGAIQALVPEVASLEKVRQQREELNKTLNALEATGGSAERIEATKKALAGVTAAERDYAVAGGAANVERTKATEVLKAGLQQLQAVTPAQKAEAERQRVLAESFATTRSGAERSAAANDAYKRSLAESAVASETQSRTQNEATKTANELARANTATGKSVEYLTAARKVDEQIAAGTIDKADRERKIREQLQNQISALNQQSAERIRAAREQTEAQEGLNQKVAAGAIASADVQRRLAGEVEVARLVREADAAQGETKAELTRRIEELRSAQEAQISAEDRSRLNSLSEEEDRRIALLQRETELLGLSTRERRTALTVLQAEQDLKRQGIGTSSPEARSYLDRVALRSDLETAKAESERFAQDMSGIFAGAFDDMFKAGNKGMVGFFDSLSKGFARIGSRMIEQNLLAPLFGGQGGFAGGAGGFDLSRIFNPDKIQEAVGLGSETGVSSALAAALKPSKPGGGIASSPLGGGLLSAGTGAAIGYQSQSPTMGALGGSLSGFGTANDDESQEIAA